MENTDVPDNKEDTEIIDITPPQENQILCSADADLTNEAQAIESVDITLLQEEQAPGQVDITSTSEEKLEAESTGTTPIEAEQVAVNDHVIVFHAPGRELLRIPGALMLFLGSIILLIALVGLSTIGAIYGAAAATASMLTILIAILPGLFEFITGILGMILANKPKRANVCLFFSIFTITFTVASMITNGVDWSGILSLVLLVLYLFGAIKNTQYVLNPL